jgi:hypothetical protein
MCLVLAADGLTQADTTFPTLSPVNSSATPVRTQHLDRPDQVPEGLSPSDWASIRAAYQAGRHQVVALEDGYHARNPEQQWGTSFDGRGFLVQPQNGHWQWGLELRAYGFPGQEHKVARPSAVNAQGQRVVYDWDNTLEEWFINDVRGLEHGFTIRQRPSFGQPGSSREQSALVFTLAVRGRLRPEVQADGTGVRFVDHQGGVALTYNNLGVVDVTGRKLPARFEPLPGGSENGCGFHLVVDQSEAHYPITIDPIVQQAYLKASNTDTGDQFGVAVAISGDTVVVGALGESSNATGVNGDQNDNSDPNAGAAYVFVRSGGVWSQQAYLKASNTGSNDLFGGSVAICGDTVVVGAPYESSKALGFTPTQAGAAYVFVRSGGVWSQQAYLKASNTAAGDSFGGSVAIAGDTVVVGAPGEGSNATGVNGDQSNKGAGDSGAAYVFVRSGGVWSQQAYLKASNTDANDFFGESVAISGDTVVVGASFESSNATGVNGNQTNNSAPLAGAAYVFVSSGGVWSQQAYLKASNTEEVDQFGVSVAISGDTVVVGAIYEASNATGVNGNQSDNSDRGAGAAYVFVRSGGVWSQQAYLKASNTDAYDYFGVSVAISDDTVVVGAFFEASNATGVNGNQSDNSDLFAGAAYVFIRCTPTASSLVVSGFPSPTTAGIPGDFTVTAVDSCGNTAENYTGTIRITSSDPAAAGFPASYTFITADLGTHTFSATLNTSGTQSLTATDESNSSITGTQTGILVPCTPPVITCPTILPVPATSPNGASVAFSVTATGPCSVSTVCVIAGTSTTVTSPYTFPIGTTKVNCTAMNSANEQDSCSFTVMVKGDTAQITDLIANVNSRNIPSAIKTALIVKLNAALKDLSVNDTSTACGDLASFISLVQAQASKKIMPSSVAKDLTSVALRIQAVIGCS